MSTNPTIEQTAYQRVYRARKKALGLCQENGCGKSAHVYRCQACAVIHAERERLRKQARTR